MLRRRHHPQTQTSGEAEGRQEEDAAVRQGRHPAGSLHCRAEGGQLRLFPGLATKTRKTTPCTVAGDCGALVRILRNALDRRANRWYMISVAEAWLLARVTSVYRAEMERRSGLVGR